MGPPGSRYRAGSHAWVSFLLSVVLGWQVGAGQGLIGSDRH